MCMLFRRWGPWRARKFFPSPNVSVQIRTFDHFPWSWGYCSWLLLSRRQHSLALSDRRWVLAGISSSFFPRLRMAEQWLKGDTQQGQRWWEQWELLPWEALTPQTELRDVETFLFYVSWSLWPVQSHPHIQTGGGLKDEKCSRWKKHHVTAWRCQGEKPTRH